MAGPAFVGSGVWMLASSRRRALPAIALLGLLALWPTLAHARVHAFSGNARYQIGNGPPQPVGFTVVPDGRVLATPSATLRQLPGGTVTTTSTTMMMPQTHMFPAPSRVVLDPGKLTAAATPLTLPVFLANSNLFQIHTSLAVQFPASHVSFRALGRTGARTVTFCHGNVVTPQGNPGCAPGGTIPGLLRYTRTSSQFGGPGRLAFQGSATGAAVAGLPAPCSGPSCQAAFFRATPPPQPALGAAFGVMVSQTGSTPSPGRFVATVAAAGTILALTPTGLGPGVPNPVQSFGGPWTTGMLTISQTVASPWQIYVFSGSDGRTVSGAGSLSLVSGAIRDSTIEGPAGVRGWLNLQIAPSTAVVPLLPPPAAAAIASLLALAGMHALVVRRGRTRRPD